MNSTKIVETPKADPQAEADARGIGIDHVGISNVLYPVLIAGWEKSNRQHTKETNLSLKVSLAPDVRGIHMSRLLEGVHHWNEPLSLTSMAKFLTMIREQQQAHSATVDCRFTWFVERPTPKTDLPAWVTTLCPCSREISDYGAHSQRGWVKVRLDWNSDEAMVLPQEVFEMLQHAGSAPIYPLLKRADERHVTMLAYQQPAFVEDTLRAAALKLREDFRIKRFELNICNEESIHTHDAIASLSYVK